MAGINLTVNLEYEEVIERLKADGWILPIRCRECKEFDGQEFCNKHGFLLSLMGHSSAKVVSAKEVLTMANKTWVVIRFGRWCHKATSLFLYDRIYRHGDKWTPLCIKSFRYVGGIGCYTDDVLAAHEHIGYDKGFRDGFAYAEALERQEVQDAAD